MPETLPKSELAPQVFAPSDALSQRAHISSFENYRKLHAESLADPETFWRRSALETLSWFHPFSQASDCDFEYGQVAWFLNGRLNACHNCVDRHVAARGDQVALIWESDTPGQGKEIEGNGVMGLLAIKRPWPGMARTIQNDHERFIQTYLRPFHGYYLTGDGCRRDEDGYYWITGRVGDVINVSGHRLGTAEVESALVTHPACAEAAVVGYPHAIKGQGIFAFVILNEGWKESPELLGELKNEVRHHIGPFATPDIVLIAPGLPKTRSGKIMRRILRSIAAGKADEMGDLTTLADPSVVDALVARRAEKD